MSVTHPTTRTQDISTCRPFRAGANCSSTQGNILFLLNSSILLKHNECSPAVPLCMCKILPPSSCGNLTRCHCKKGTWKCSALHQLTHWNTNIFKCPMRGAFKCPMRGAFKSQFRRKWQVCTFVFFHAN